MQQGAVEPHDRLPAGAGGDPAAGIPDGLHACPKGLRHSFGVQAVSRGIALNMVQKWLGHAQLTTTAVYVNPIRSGETESDIRSGADMHPAMRADPRRSRPPEAPQSGQP